jgi:urea transport system ATP-binding protein
VLTVEALDVFYGRTQVLFGVSLEVPTDGLMCIMGRNGVGKTTLLNAIMGILRSGGGRITFEGRDITRLRPEERVRAGLGYVPQGRQGFPQLTVLENLTVVRDACCPKDRTVIDETLDLFPRLRQLLGRPAGFLSGGQQQQLAIARALMSDPSILLLDEPSQGLDPQTVSTVFDSIALLCKRGLTILLVDQNVSRALSHADTAYVLAGGRVIKHGRASELVASEIEDAYLGTASVGG